MRLSRVKNHTRSLPTHPARWLDVVPDVDTPAGRAWLRGLVIAYVQMHPGVTEDRILRHVERTVTVDPKGVFSDVETADLLADLVIKERVLRWAAQKGNPDAPLKYWWAGAAT